MPANTPSMWTPEAVEKLRLLCAEGYSAKQIAAMFGVTRNTIMGAVYRNGYALKGGLLAPGVKKLANNRLPDQVRAKARTLWDDGLSRAAIARDLRVGHSTVNEWAMEWPAREAARSQPKPKPVVEKVTPPPKPVVVAVAPPPEPEPVSGIPCRELTYLTCRWPINTWPRGMGEDALFCGAKAEGRYCKRHERMAGRVAA